MGARVPSEGHMARAESAIPGLASTAETVSQEADCG